MAQRMTMLWFLLLLVGAVLGVLAAIVPGRAFRLAYRNSRRPDGSVHPRRCRREAKHFLDLLGGLLLAPLFAFVLTGALLVGVHEYIVPIPMVADIFSAFDADAARWEYNIEHGDLGDVGAHYEEWSRTRGYSASRARFWQEFLWHNWLWLLGLGIAFGALQYWFWTHYYVAIVATYYEGLLKRRGRYRKRDREKYPSARKSASSRTAGRVIVGGTRRTRPAHQRRPRPER